MAEDEFQSNWRGARKYQFDEETRRKQAALDRRFPDPDPAPLPQPTEPPSTEAVPLPKPGPRRRWLFIAMMLLLLATVASIAGYLTLLLYERQQIVPPPKAQPQSSTPNPSLPAKMFLPPERPRD